MNILPSDLPSTNTGRSPSKCSVNDRMKSNKTPPPIRSPVKLPSPSNLLARLGETTPNDSSPQKKSPSASKKRFRSLNFDVDMESLQPITPNTPAKEQTDPSSEIGSGQSKKPKTDTILRVAPVTPYKTLIKVDRITEENHLTPPVKLFHCAKKAFDKQAMVTPVVFSAPLCSTTLSQLFIATEPTVPSAPPNSIPADTTTDDLALWLYQTQGDNSLLRQEDYMQEQINQGNLPVAPWDIEFGVVG